MTATLANCESVLTAQHGLVTRRQLTDQSVSERQITRLVQQRVLKRVRPGVLGLVGAGDSWERGLLAVVLSVDDSVASHAAAARLWKFEPRPEDRYEVTVAGTYRTSMRGVTIHRTRVLHEADVVRAGDIARTSFERTLCDCTTVLNEYQLGRVLDDGLRRGVASLRRLGICAERLESGPGRHMSVVRALLADRGIGFNPGGSRSELQLLDVVRRGGLPLPLQQLPVMIGAQEYRPDFAWPEFKVFAEYYGLPFHIGATAVASDSKRLTALSAAGWLPLVFTSASTDVEIIDRVTAALRQRGYQFEPST
jgi:hypothetical protein